MIENIKQHEIFNFSNYNDKTFFINRLNRSKFGHKKPIHLCKTKTDNSFRAIRIFLTDQHQKKKMDMDKPVVQEVEHLDEKS